jgi:hypothetical protein
MKKSLSFGFVFLLLATTVLANPPAPFVGEAVEDMTVTETPIVNNGRRYIKLEYDGRFYVFEMLKPDSTDANAYGCVDDQSFVGSSLVTGAIKTTQRSTVFLSALKEKCVDKKIVVDPIATEDLKVGVGWGGKKGERSKVYTQPLGAFPNLGFSTKFD